MVKIAFLTPQIDARGSCVALYDYAKYNVELLGNESLIVVQRSGMHYYDTLEDLEEFLLENNTDILYCIKHGQKDGILLEKIPTVIHCVFDMSSPHGKVQAAVSETLAKKYGQTVFVPHMVALQPSRTKENLRKSLEIPENAIVFGRYGGEDTFNLEFVRNTIRKIVEERGDIYFLFMNTPVFVNHSRVIFLDSLTDEEEKNRFICTCDAHIEAGSLGHTFGLAIAEFSVNNKPIIAYTGQLWNRAHLDILGEEVMGYENETEFYNILNTFDPKGGGKNCYLEYTPEKVMRKFKEVFIDPIH
jgi:hypothetical protein